MENREIDRLVAEKVMGWVAASEVMRDEDTKLPFTRRYWSDTEGNYTNQFHFVPCERIQDAWLVVEHFIKKGWDFSIETTLHFNFVVDFNDGGANMYCETSESAPMAICLAALKVVGVDING